MSEIRLCIPTHIADPLIRQWKERHAHLKTELRQLRGVIAEAESILQSQQCEERYSKLLQLMKGGAK